MNEINQTFGDEMWICYNMCLIFWRKICHYMNINVSNANW